MKNNIKKLLLPIVVTALIAPSIALAAWWNPLSWFNHWGMGVNKMVITPSCNQGNVWQVSGKITDGVLEWRPIYSFDIKTGSPSFSTEDGGDYRIEVRDINGKNLYSRFFSAGTVHIDYLPGQTPEKKDTLQTKIFSELVPLQTEAASIVISDRNGKELARKKFGGEPPEVSIVSPKGGETISGNYHIQWSVSNRGIKKLTFMYQYSWDGGMTWATRGSSMTGTGDIHNFDTVRGTKDKGLIRVYVSDGVNSCNATSKPFSVPVPDDWKPPTISIMFPKNNDVFRSGVRPLYPFSGDAQDGQGYDLIDNSVVWTSNKDGVIGYGDDIGYPELSAGKHTITVTVTDVSGLKASQSVTFTVQSTEEYEKMKQEQEQMKKAILNNDPVADFYDLTINIVDNESNPKKGVLCVLSPRVQKSNNKNFTAISDGAGKCEITHLPRKQTYIIKISTGIESEAVEYGIITPRDVDSLKMNKYRIVVQ